MRRFVIVLHYANDVFNDRISIFTLQPGIFSEPGQAHRGTEAAGFSGPSRNFNGLLLVAVGKKLD